MVEEFNDVIKNLTNSKDFKDFKVNHKDYYLAHGFLQLNKDLTEKSPWQIGFYSHEKDDLAIFETNPTKLLPFEKAFKKDGIISELKNPEKLISTSEIIKKLSLHLQTKYSSYIPNSYLLIVQIIKEKAVYNITTITTSFHMVNTRFDAITGEIILDEFKSILDLRNNTV